MTMAEPEYAFAALADPTRRAILRILRKRDSLTVGALAEEFPDITRAGVSAHLRVLRHARLVEEKRSGKYRVYSLGPNRADEVVKFLSEVYRQSLEDLQNPRQDEG
ncbi:MULTISPECIES: metalloregulator ArsR/SmtB family transcription factor [unclassified Pseudofrankia]|uniref:metalloregulator ArsR/SmtB family transcription factor n=1 Tax=unclassified Pseudofrankia TaxID=2994372 RepID=UPI000A625C27|nr:MULTISPECIES: metalloregulator ArsR/SmtB family transcription factor [unclassified Pseudofrankia]MDT3441836.1 metalloregulator ArsR/SmtB family transcription factor [Pseudofrankia sp. BMG5.37]